MPCEVCSFADEIIVLEICHAMQLLRVVRTEEWSNTIERVCGYERDSAMFTSSLA